MAGPDASSKLVMAWHVTSAFGRVLYTAPAEAFPSSGPDLNVLARLFDRESRLANIALHIEAGSEYGTSPMGAAVRRFLYRTEGFLTVGVRETWQELARPFVAVEVRRPSADEQRVAWSKALGGAAGTNSELLSSHFNLEVATIQDIAKRALQDGRPDAGPLDRRLWERCAMTVRPQLDRLARRLGPRETSETVILPLEQVQILEQIKAQVGLRSRVYQDWGFGSHISRGLGITVLFSGASGTGKTLAAEVLARELRLNLYCIDLSAVISKYIGETEKNLRILFDAAEDGGAILFFDEADALFGKRSEVRDSHDRYANIEINYLLQRMEAFRGLSILATNLQEALDPAFLRRIRFVVQFPFPALEDRRRIWETIFPARVPRRNLDYDRLARLNVTGGSIHVIALNAAFLAAQEGSEVTMRLIMKAARTEFQKLNRPILESDLIPGAE
jgi:hypothetical protein